MKAQPTHGTNRIRTDADANAKMQGQAPVR